MTITEMAAEAARVHEQKELDRRLREARLRDYGLYVRPVAEAFFDQLCIKLAPLKVLPNNLHYRTDETQIGVVVHRENDLRMLHYGISYNFVKDQLYLVTHNWAWHSEAFPRGADYPIGKHDVREMLEKGWQFVDAMYSKERPSNVRTWWEDSGFPGFSSL